MKFNRKGKTVFAIALTACMAGMAFSALPLLSVHAVEEKLHSCTNGKCDENGYNPAGPCTTYTYAATKDTTWDELQKAAESVTCTGWTFDGWYTSPLEYTFWGGKDKIFGYECQVLYPEQGWEHALEFTEISDCKNGITGNNYETAKSNSEVDTKYYFKEGFNRWLTRFKDEKWESECKNVKTCGKEIIEETEEKIQEYKVTSDTFDEKVGEECKKCEKGVTLYARMKPDTVKVNFYVDRSELNGWNAKAGCYVEYGYLYMTCSYPFGTPLGELFQDVSGLKVEGWRKNGTEDPVESETCQWKQQNLEYKWSSQILNEEFATSIGNGWWKVDLVAIMEGETKEETTKKVESEQAELEKSTQEKGMLKSAANGMIEAEHHCGNGTLVFQEATCQATGIKAHFQCSCGKLYWDQGCTQPVDKDADFTTEMHHNLIKIQGKKATCTEAGKADRWFCNTCHKSFTDEKGEHEASDFTIEALGHDYGNGTNGNKVCTRCGNVDESSKNTVEPEVKPQDQPQVQPQAQEQPTIEEEKKEAPKTETKKEVKEETKPAPKQETTAPQTPVAPEQDEEEEKDEVVIEREQQTRPSSRRSARA